jgi:hypothetical protein
MLKMKKNFYNLFGSRRSIEDVAALIHQRLDLDFVRHESSYVGEYFKYAGLYSDKITIERNRNDVMNEWKTVQFKDYPTLIYVSNTVGKNADKLSKTKYVREQFCRIPDITLLSEKVIEEP